MGISLCMIVKNEEDWVAGAIHSVISIVDEVIIADTGSVDATLARIRPFNPVVINLRWTDHFGDARNATLARARQPWVLVLDADERIAAKDLPALVEAAKSDFDGYHLIQRNYVNGNQVFGWKPNTGEYEEGRSYSGWVDNPLIRFFRNSSDLRFLGAVHEIIDPTRLDPKLKFGSMPAVIHHYGKVRGDERVAAKQRLYLALGLKKIGEEPDNAKAYFDLGIQYQELGRHAEASTCFDQTFTMTKLPLALLYWAISEKHLRNYQIAAGLLRRARSLGLDTFDVHLELGNVHLAEGALEHARTEYEKCLKIRPGNPVAAFNCGLVHRKIGDLGGAEHWYKRDLEFDRTFRRAVVELASLYDESRRYEDAVLLLKPIVERNPDYREGRLTLAKTYIQMNNSDDAIDLLKAHTADDAIALSLIGAAHLQKNQPEEARSYLESALKLDRSLIDARINLAQVYTLLGDHARAERHRLSVTARESRLG
jgi:tetratricopeptide (TPR) repeat protein